MYNINLKQVALIACIATSLVACKKDAETPKDSKAPTVTLAVDKATIIQGMETSTVTATATDEAGGSGVEKVEFWVGTTKLGEATTAPYTYKFTGKDYTFTSAQITAKAIDKANNTGTAASPVTVNVNGIKIEAEEGQLVVAPGSGAKWETREDGNKHYAFVNEQESGADIPVTVPTAGNYKVSLVAATGWVDNPVTARVAANDGEFQEVDIPVTGWVDFVTYEATNPVALNKGANMIKARQGQWFHHLDAIIVTKE